MKIVFACICFLVLIYKTSAECRSDCRDIFLTSQCRLMKPYCDENETVQKSCMKTCGKCITCEGARVPTCATSCRDLSGPLACFYMTQMRFGCLIFARQCQATCKYCRGCLLPPQELNCTDSCADENVNCPYWKEQGYCHPRRSYPQTRTVCQLSCGICRPCSTALPPTEEEDYKRKKKRAEAMALVRGLQQTINN